VFESYVEHQRFSLTTLYKVWPAVHMLCKAIKKQKWFFF